MPTKNPRINIVLERPLYEVLQQMAQRENVSLSMKVRDLVRESIDRQEDLALAGIAEEREAAFDPSRGLRHDDVWATEST